MKQAGSWLRACGQRLAGMSAGRRAVVAVAIALILVGLGWLALAGRGQMVPVLDRQWTQSELAEAQKALSSRGIDFRLEAGRLVVPRPRLQEARDLLHQEVLDAGGDSLPLEQLAQKEDVWSSQSQIARRWQAAKMASMAHLIRRFPPVRSATVIFEEGTAGGVGGTGLGAAPTESTASVGVELKSGCSMSDDLVEAIADLVSGGVAGMKRQNVRVVDSSGKSYRAAETLASDAPAMRQLRAADDYFTKKVRSAIPRIEGAVVAVRVEPRGPAQGAAKEEMPRCAEVRVSIPRSYFLGVARATTGQDRPDEAAVQSAIAAGLEQVRDMVTAAVGPADPAPAGSVSGLTAGSPARIRVDWHCDEAAAPVEAPPIASPKQADFAWQPWAWAAGAGAGVGACLCAIAGRLFRRRRGNQSPADAIAIPDLPDADYSKGVLGILQWASAEDLLSLVRDEHPQTIAVMLSALPADRADAVLAALPPEHQEEVARRIAALERIEPQTLREVESALASRLAETAGEQRPAAGGVAKLADLLHRAGRQTQTRVAQSLSGEVPDLAQSLHKRTMSFEDISSLGDSRLGSVLETMDSRRLAVALRTASKLVAQKVFSCLSAAAVRRLRAQMEHVGPVRLSDVEATQQQIVEELLVAEDGQYAATGADRIA